MTIGVESGSVMAVYLALFVAGIGYNLLTAWMESRGYLQGYTAFLVTGGVLITLLGVAMIDLRAAVLAFGAFAACGLPMVLGSVWRYMRAREDFVREMREEARRANPD